MFGAEQTLMNRAVDEAVVDIVAMVNDFKAYPQKSPNAHWIA